ncbi:MAG TPA: SDR family oxidoreductase [Ktedonobacteraceae bacterium]|nr:SDR family oxidoreductase [Ktedonobacteraceae bacterium]
MAEATMQGKVCLVTGSSTGIGKATARELARMGATVVLVCRSQSRGEAAQAEIKQSTGNDQVDLIVADLSLLLDVRRVAETFRQRYSQLHVLINNAGAANHTRQITSDGLESTFALNYLAPFLLTELLLDVLKASAPARIINVSSMNHRNNTIHFDDLQGGKKYNMWRAYGQSKLALILFTYELADQLKGTGVTVNALHPGIIASEFGRGLGGFLHGAWKVIAPFISTVEQGAQTTLYLATSPAVEGVSGKYFINSKEAQSSRRSHDKQMRLRLWQVTQDLLEAVKTPQLPQD